MPVPAVPFTDERLPNGLRLVISEDHLVPVVAVNLWYDVGSKHEVPGKTGFAHLFEHVMFQGSRHVAKAEHFALIQAAGGTMNGTTWLDRTNYFETVPSHQLELALWLEADRLATLLDALSQENLDNQRAVVQNEKRVSYDNQPYGTWQEKMLAHLYPPEHPYHHPTIGSMEDLEAASLDDVRTFFRTYYAPNNAVLSIVGDVDPTRARAWVAQYFGPIPANPAIPPLVVEPLPLTLGGERRETVEDRVPLPRIFAGYRAPALGDGSLYALEIAAQILAGGKGSRLHRRLVREDRIAQDVALFLLPFASGPSIFMGWATVRPEATIEAVEAGFLGELAGLAAGDVTDDELLRAKALIETDELGSLQRVAERADRLSMYATLLDEPDEANRQLERYLSVTAEDVRAACATVLAEDNRVVLTYVPTPGSTGGDEEAGDDEDGASGGPLGDGTMEAGA
ncbi:MAG: pitrilysin family protein [Chloroflexi bacterium]|nr:pitrilysin family protein [Chloroflexota bacterium]